MLSAAERVSMKSWGSMLAGESSEQAVRVRISDDRRVKISVFPPPVKIS